MQISGLSGSVFKKYAATAFQGIQKDNDEDERQEQAANAVEDMMARCRAFVRERQSERGERAENGGEEGDEDGDHPPPALPKAEEAPEPQPPQPEVPKVEPTVTKGVASRSRSEGRLKKEKVPWTAGWSDDRDGPPGARKV
ncbi:Uncharacterized protein SCF082_LOCUS14885 [Durusdinium trenchii]|uniref:Uncharacterized protein n=1 Tax=Durusdinium trenchii TaxID=1381693 RepID=A0ABP0K178_9DINO